MNTVKKIDKDNIENVMGLTSTQEGMLFHYLREPNSIKYHEQLSLTFLGDINVQLFQEALNFVVETNEMLRTVFRWQNIEKPVQIVLKNHVVSVVQFDLSRENKQEEVLCDIKAKDMSKTIDITSETLRVYLCKMSDNKHEMIISNHHILYDGWSNGIILKEFLNTYDRLCAGNEPIRIYKNKFKEFIKFNKEQDKTKQKEYWQNYLGELEENNNFLNRSSEKEDLRVFTYKFSDELTEKIKNYSKENRISLSAILYCTWGILLQCISNSGDVIFGTTVSGRNVRIKGIDDIVGLFINTIPLRVKFYEYETAEQLIKRIDSSLKEREDFENTSLVDIKEYCNMKNNGNLFETLVVVENYPLDYNMDANKTLKIDKYSMVENTNYNITLGIMTFKNLELHFNYNNSVISEELVLKLGCYFQEILESIVKDKNMRVKEIEILTSEEKKRLIYEFNNTDADYPKDRTLNELFEEQAEKTPYNTAVVFEDRRLSFKELNEKANRLARTLRGKGVKPDSIVGIMLEPSLEMIVGMFAVLKAGGAYLPIDPEYPEDRVMHIINDSNTNILLTQSKLTDRFKFNGISIDLENEEIYSQAGGNLESISTGKNLAYIIYTSGSTGMPKGVMIEHRSIVMTLLWRKEQYKLGCSDSVLQLFSSAFDGFVTSFYTPIISGAKVVLLNKNEAKDVFSIKEKIALHKITHFISVPSMCLAIMDCLTDLEASSLRIITLAGENLTSKVVEKCKSLKENIEIVNEYGPTENSVVTTIMRDIDTEKEITIGKPKDNTKIYIVNSNNKLQPIGVPGEICISGEGLARGYLNRPELTKERFVQNPFFPGTIMYKTGDLGKWLSDGNIDFLGRIDHQVKIRGFRIELGEIEKQILSYDLVKEAVVVDKQDINEDKYLCAYIVGDKTFTMREIREHLLKKLPKYMIPTYLVQLDKLPVTQNGKIDKKMLPEPDGKTAIRTEYEAPRTELEERLVSIWKEVLLVESVGINDDFFQLGGHSLKAMALVSKIHKVLNVEITVKEIFNFTTIKEISDYIKKKEKSMYASIKPVEKKEYYEASSAQKRMFMLQQLDLQSTGYNISGALQIDGKLNKEKLQETFNKLIGRHEALRTSFEAIENSIVQRVNENINIKIDYFEVNSSESTEKAVDKLVTEFIKPFDLNKAPLFNVGLIKLEEEKHILILDMHHIISDGISMGIFIREFIKLYNGEALEELNVQYKDFSEWQSKLLKSEEIKKQEEYWTRNFSDEIPVLNMPTDYVRPTVQSFEGDNISFKLDKNLTSDIKRLTKETGSTMYMVLLSGINILLAKYSGQKDIVIGSPIAGRPHADLEKIIGMFVNTLAMRSYPEGSKTFEEFLKEVKLNSLMAYENQDYQFEELVEKLNLRRDISRNPLFDVMFTMQNMDFEEIALDGLNFKSYKQDQKVSKFDLTFIANEVDEEVLINLEYCTKLFKRETIERMIGHLINIFKAVVNDIKVKLCEINILTEEEKKKLLNEFNDTASDYPRDKTIPELFEEQVEKTPNKVAVVFEDKKLTYIELQETSNSLAGVLKEKGVKPDGVVGILAERSIDMIVGVLAILKAGGAYLPIDPEYPEERISYMLQDCNASVLLVQGGTVSNFNFDGEIIDISNKNLYSKPSEIIKNVNTAKDLAYIIYTSGSTGKPKGVMVEHRGVVRLIKNTNYITFRKDDKILQTGTLAFDASTFEIWGAILNGLELHLANKYTILNTEKIEQYINENNITILWLTAALFSYMAQEKPAIFKNLRYLLAGGDVLPANHINRVIRECRDLKIVNGYGPTENTTFSTCFIIDKEYENNIPIGKPISNSTAYIADKYNKLMPIGVYGELCVGGDGLSRGYLNNSELTGQKFISNPFIEGMKMYKTGDLARWLPDGNIEFKGRIDHQIKLRGFRIELGEIEKQLLDYEGIKETVVIAREDISGNKYLCAYIVAQKEVLIEKLREYISKKLPDYMIPAYFIKLDKMPVTLNGKIDRRALPEPSGNIVTAAEYEAPRNELEEKLVFIWQEVLGVERVGINDNFFELGGHSLKATVLASRIHKELNSVIALREIFKLPTIKGISQYIKNTEISVYEAIKPVEEREFYEASSAQKRMYMLQQFDLKSTGYNMPEIFEVEGKLDVEKLEKVFNKLVDRHEALRTSFCTREGNIVQIVNEKAEIEIEIECAEVSEVLQEVAIGKTEFISDRQIKDVFELINSFVRAFDLSKAPLLRVGFIKLEEHRNILMVDMHHIISDGVSMSLFISEFTKLYEGQELDKLRVQYKDYSEWQNRLLKSDEIKKQEKYWTERFLDDIPVLNMPTDYVRPAVQSFEGDSISFKLDSELTKGLNRIAKETGSTMYMVLLSAVNILLSKYSGQEDIIVGTPIAGRPHADLEKIIGMFVNTLAMRNHPLRNKGYIEFLKEVKENALEAYENQDYQFEELVEMLNLPRDISRNPLFDVMFTMQNMDLEEIKLKNLTFKKLKQDLKAAKFDLTISANEVEENIILCLEYSTNLFKETTIERMIEHLVNILMAVVENPKVKLSEIDMITEEEKHKLLYEFNDTNADYPRESTIHKLFEEKVKKIPDNIAVVFENRTLTYRQLNEKANSLAGTLREKGVKPDSIVGIMAERSFDMIVGILGILKAGGAYLPIDPKFPQDRIEHILEHSKTNLLLTQNKFMEKAKFNGEILNLGDENLYLYNRDNLNNINSSKDLAYIIYTSGSTGDPKGVMIEHGSVINTLIYMESKYPLVEGDSYLLKTSYTFDVSVTELFGWFIGSGKLIILKPDGEKDAYNIINTIKNHNVTHINFAPSMLNIFLDGLEDKKENVNSLKYVFSAGEAISKELVRKFLKFTRGVRLENIYGPTEATIYVTAYSIDDTIQQINVPIGKPLANTKAYIMNKDNRLQPIGVAGELYFSGDGLSRGYLNNAELTSEKFISNPFIIDQRIYKTGDLARWMPDGNIEFLGRMDHQVKIRGFRIELGEIESQLLNHEDIKEVIVVDRDDKNGSKYLCAYIISCRNLTVSELRQYLAKKLPEYMIPSYFVLLDKMPLNPSGKIDRRKLPEPEGNVFLGSEYITPRNEIEEKLVSIWKEVLAVERVGIQDNFFELGGHSLKAMQVISLVEKYMYVKIELADLFNRPTIAELGELIANSEISKVVSIDRLPERDYYELSYSQKRLWIINELDSKSIAYNMPGQITLREKVDVNIVKRVFEQLTIRHEALRTKFKVVDGNPVQVIDDVVQLPFKFVNISEVKDGSKSVKREEIFKELSLRIFNLQESPLMYVTLVKVNEEEYDLDFSMHHIISDGYSLEVLKNEFYILYNEYKQGKEGILAPLRIQYKDFAAWQNKLLEDKDRVKQAKEYWVKQLSGQLPVLELPVTYSYSNLNSRNSSGYRIVLSEDIKNKLKELANKYNTSLFVVILSAFKLYLWNLTAQKDILVGTAGLGRNHADLRNVIGYFINTTILRNQIDIEENFEELLQRINANTVKALEYQYYPTELIVDELKIKYPKINVFINMLNMGQSDKAYIEDFQAYHIEKVQDVKFDLVWYITEYANGVEIICNYLSDLFDMMTIEFIMDKFIKLLENILDNTTKPLKELKSKKKRSI